MDEQQKIHEDAREAVNEILRACREENILMPFLQTHEKDVQDIMVTQFEQEFTMMKMFGKEVREEDWQEERQEGLSDA